MPKRKAHDGLYQRERGGIWWMRVDPVTGNRGTTGCKGLEAARLFRAEREREAADPAYAAATKATVGIWANKLQALKEQSRSAGTADMYRTKLGHVVRLFGARAPMSSITPGLVDAYVSSRREEGASDNTISKELIALQQLCALAKRTGQWAGDLATLRPVGFSSGYEPRKNALTPVELSKLSGALPAQWRDHMRVAIATGARRSELLRVHFVPRPSLPTCYSVRIQGTKTDGSDRLFDTVSAWQASLLEAVGFDWNPRPWQNMNRDLAAASKAAKLPFAVTPNDLRRTFASWLIEAGVTREEVAKMLGHRGTAMVFRVYGRADPAKEGESIRRRIGKEIGKHPAPHGLACTDPSQSPFCSGPEGAGAACFPG